MVGRHARRNGEPAQRQATFRFGDFELRAGRELCHDGKPVAIGRIALDLLGALVGARGELVTKEELFDAAWPGVVVVENALHQHMRALRRALGEQAELIGTVARRGYRFLGEIEELPADAGPGAAFGAATAMPWPITPLIGREVELAAIAALLDSHRCVSLLGPGGVGKTRLALELAATAQASAAGRVAWAELAAIAEGQSVPDALAAAFGLPGPSSLAPLARLRHALRDTAALLVLDNCEHLIEACTSAAHELLRHCPGLRVLATSQRPLGIVGEQRFQVPLLAVPPAAAASATIAASPAIRLLLTRVREANPSWRCDEEGLSDAAELCRQLDGNALAIELAAARVATLGLATTRSALAERFRLLAGARRDGPPKHQSLDAMIDWSHGLLTPDLQLTFRRLAVFSGGWTIESARAVVGDASDDGAGSPDMASRLADLVERSMITCESSARPTRFKLLEAQRVYAFGQLQASGERARYASAHARHLCAVFEASYAAWDDTADGAWIARYGPERDNLRAAIRCALEAPEDAALAARLVGSSIWLWRAIGAIGELQQILEQVLLGSAAALRGDVQARLLLAQAYSLHATSSESLRVLAAAERAVAAFKGTKYDPLGEANARLCLASAYAQLGDTAAQLACLGEVDALFGERRHGKAYGWYCGSHAWASQLAGDLREALQWAMRSRAAYRGSGAWHGETRAMLHTADLRLALGDVDAAIAIGEESATRLESRHHRDDHGRALANLGAAWFAHGNLAEARRCWERALDELRGLDFSYWVFDHIAALAIAEGREDCAAQMIGYADAGYARLRKGKRVQNEQRAHGRAMAHLAAYFDAAELATLLSVGADATEDDVIALALQQPGATPVPAQAHR